jgi:hypothetical protein
MTRVEISVGLRELATPLPGPRVAARDRPAEWRAHPAFHLLAGLYVACDAPT